MIFEDDDETRAHKVREDLQALMVEAGLTPQEMVVEMVSGAAALIALCFDDHTTEEWAGVFAQAVEVARMTQEATTLTNTIVLPTVIPDA
tara:strand:- start:3583 stop:3852 length:270 start_codon:yes stop_codon:yes gene_type:complete